MSEPITLQGRGTKERIVAVAAALMYEHGVSAVSLDDILLAASAGKGQFYHYFSNREELVTEVLRHQLEQVLEEQKHFDLDTWEGIHAWLESMVGMQENQRRFRGCPLGTIASDVVEPERCPSQRRRRRIRSLGVLRLSTPSAAADQKTAENRR